MFVIFTLLLTTALAHSHEKYIDLLPEEEKQHFLDKVARRIMGTFEDADDKNGFNKELTEDQQETTHLRRRRADYKSSEEENKGEEIFDVPLNSNKTGNHDSDNIDFSNDDEKASLPGEKKRHSYDAFKQKSEEITPNNVRTDNESKEKETVEQLLEQTSKGEESQTEKLKDPELSTVDFHMTTEHSAEIISTTEFQKSLTDETNSHASRTYELNYSGDKTDIDVKKPTNDIKNSLRAEDESKEKRIFEKLPDKKSNEDESDTEKLKVPELSTTDVSMLTEKQTNIVSTTEFYDFTSEVTNYNALITSAVNESNDENHLNIKKAIKRNKDDKVTENVSSMNEGESDEKGSDESKENSQQELLPEKMKIIETTDIISTTESQDFTSEEINYTAYEPTTYEPIMSDDTNDKHLKKYTEVKMTAKSILLLDLNSKSTTRINLKNKTTILHKPEVSTNDEDSVLSIEELNKESTLEHQSEQTSVYKQTSNVPDSSQGDKEKDDSTNDEASTRSISLDTNDSLIPSSTATEIDIATTANYPPVSENLSPKVALATTTTQATVLQALTSANTVPINKNLKRTRFKIITKPSDKSTFDTKIVEKVRKDKLETELKKNTSKNHKKIEVATERSSLPHYQVYEIPWPDSSKNPPFLRNDKPMKKLPFPVYENSPNYLHYNPTNRLKPSVKNNAIGRDARRLREGGNITDVKLEEPLLDLPTAVIKKEGDIRKFGVYKKKPKKYVEEPTSPPSTVSPEDMNFEQQNTVTDVQFPGSNEHGHPIYSLKKGHLHVIKRLLFEKQMNGWEPYEINEYLTYLFDKYGLYHQNSLEENSVELTTSNDPTSPENHHIDDVNNEKGSEETLVNPTTPYVPTILYNHSLENSVDITPHEPTAPSNSDKYDDSNQSSSKEKSFHRTAPYKHNKNIFNIDYAQRKMNRNLNSKIKALIKVLHRLQVQNHPNDQKMNDLLISNYIEDKHHGLKRIKMLTTKNSSQEDVDLSTIAKILKLTDEKDVFPVLEKMQQLNFKLMRRNEDVKISIYLKVLSDLIQQDSKALKHYDWLATTVQIQSALEKLFLLINKMNESETIHPADMQILKYCMFLHNYLIELKRAKTFKTKLKNYVNLLSRDKKRRRNRGGTDTRILHKVWGYIRKLLPDSTAGDGLNNLNEFLLDVEKGLYDLHQAIKSISMITTFNHQNWFLNLRQLYLRTNEKHLLQLLLHMSFSRLVELVEHSCENGLEDNFITYMKTHKKESKRTLEEMMFVMMIVDEIKSSLE